MSDDEVPDGCPRAIAGAGPGPRKCPWVTCPSHLHNVPRRGPISPRYRLVLLLDDTCARDVRDRAKASHVELTYHELGVLLGCSPQAAKAAEQRALVKVQRRVRSR